MVVCGWFRRSFPIGFRSLFRGKPGKNFGRGTTSISGGFNPVQKICSSNWIISPKDWGENKKSLSCHHFTHGEKNRHKNPKDLEIPGGSPCGKGGEPGSLSAMGFFFDGYFLNEASQFATFGIFLLKYRNTTLKAG